MKRNLSPRAVRFTNVMVKLGDRQVEARGRASVEGVGVVLASFCRAFAFVLVLRVGACNIRVLLDVVCRDVLSG
jgi:hypothetical protein